VKDTAGNPISTARRQVFTMEASGPVSQENSVCTWLSEGRVLKPVTKNTVAWPAGLGMNG